VGVRGSRIKNIVDELGGEKIDIVRWNESSKMLIANALKPAEVAEIALCFELGRATVVVTDDQLSLAIGKRGQNVRLAARLTGWDIDILTPEEFNVGLDAMEKSLRDVEGIDSTLIDQVIAMGMVSVMDIEEVGPEPFINELGMEPELAQKVVIRCAEEAKRVAEAQAKAKAKKKDEHPPAETAPKGELAEDGEHASAAGAERPQGQAGTPEEEAAAVEAAQAAGETPEVAPPAESVEAPTQPAETPAGEMKDVTPEAANLPEPIAESSESAAEETSAGEEKTE
jgi:N utilization substance protein A